MVEEEEDIANVDLKELEVGAAEAEAKPTAPEPVKQEVKQPAKTAQASTNSAAGTPEFYEELDHILHSGDIKVAPAAGWYLRNYAILPSQVTASGPKGYITKGDVLEYIQANNLQQKQPVLAQPAAQAAPAQPK